MTAQSYTTGDFNAPDINWLTLYAGSPFSCNLCNTLHHLNYLQLVNTPTHQAGNTLDLILTKFNAPHRISNIAVSTDSNLNSDHFLVMADILLHSYTNSTKPAGAGSYSLNAPNYCRANLPALADHLTDSLMLYNSFSPQQRSLSALRDAITLSTSVFVPSAIIPSKMLHHIGSTPLLGTNFTKLIAFAGVLNDIQRKCLEQDSCRWKESFNLSFSLPKRTI